MLIVGVARVLQFILLLLTLHIATTLMVPAEMGKVALIAASVAFFALFMLNPVGMFINRRLHAWDQQGRAKAYLRYFWVYLACVSATAMVMLYGVLGSGWWTPDIDRSQLLLLVGASLAFGTLNQAVIPWLNLIGASIWFAVLTVASTLASLVIALALVQTIEPVASLWISGLIGGQLLVGMLALFLFGRKLRAIDGDRQTELSREKMGQLVRFAWPVAVAVSLGWIQSQSYRFIVEQRLGLAELGLFVAGFGISAGISAGFESVVSTYFQPIFYRKLNATGSDAHANAWEEYAKSTLPSMALTAILIFVLAPDLTQILLGPEYRDSYPYVMWGALAEMARMATGIFALFAHAKMKTHILIGPNLLGAALAVALVWLLVGEYGTHGVGLALVISSVGSLALTIYITSKLTRIRLPLGMVARIAGMGILLLIMARVSHVLLAGSNPFFGSLMVVLVTGVIFLVFQFHLLKGSIKNSPQANSAS